MALPYVSLEEDDPDNDLDLVPISPTDPEPFITARMLDPSLATASFSFSHVPPPTLQGSRRWPGRVDCQSPSSDPLLLDTWVHVQRFLAPQDRRHMLCLSSAFSFGVLCSPLWLTRPWQPHRRRRFGFGKVCRARSATTASPTLSHIYHHLWPFLSSSDRQMSQSLSPVFLRYTHFSESTQRFIP